MFPPRARYGAAQGTLRYDPISTNGPQSITAFPRENTRIGAADMPCHRPTSWIYNPRDFPQWANPEIFRHVRIGKAGGGTRFYQESARAKMENGNSPESREFVGP